MSSFAVLAQRRAVLQNALDMISASIRDMEMAGREGSEAAGWAACWAAVLMAADIVKIGLSTVNQQAAAGFEAIDKGVAGANKLLKRAGMRQIATKDDVLGSLEGGMGTTATLLSSVRTARDVLKKAKIEASGPTELVLDLVMSMTEDTLLLLHAGMMQGQVTQQTQAAKSQAATHLRRVRAKLRAIDEQLVIMLQAGEQRSRTA